MRRTSVHLPGSNTSLTGVLVRPDAPGPFPTALLLHGYASRKEAMVDSVGRALTERGVAALALDLPLHGERAQAGVSGAVSNPLSAVRLWRLALHEATLALAYLRTHPDVDPQHLGLVGYSLGSFLALALATRDAHLSPVVLAASGDLPGSGPPVRLARTILDPLNAVRTLRGRPLLMVCGRHDRTFQPAQALRLYEAAREPKDIRWWDAGHILPPAAITEAAAWFAGHAKR